MSLAPEPGRWPEHASADRLTLGTGMAAVAAARVPGSYWDSSRDALRRLAEGLTTADPGPLPGDLLPLGGFGRGNAVLSIVPWNGVGMTRISTDVVISRAGPVPRLRSRDGGAGPALALAALALLLALAADDDRDGRVALGLGVEGLLSWYRESNRAGSPRLPLAFALEHVRARLREGGDDRMGAALDASWR